MPNRRRREPERERGARVTGLQRGQEGATLSLALLGITAPLCQWVEVCRGASLGEE